MNTPTPHSHIYRRGIDDDGEYQLCQCGHKVSTPHSESLAPLEWLVDSLATIIADASPEELPGLHSMLEAISGAIAERFEEHSLQERQEGYKKGWIDAKLEDNAPEAGDAQP